MDIQNHSTLILLSLLFFPFLFVAFESIEVDLLKFSQDHVGYCWIFAPDGEGYIHAVVFEEGCDDLEIFP